MLHERERIARCAHYMLEVFHKVRLCKQSIQAYALPGSELDVRDPSGAFCAKGCFVIKCTDSLEDRGRWTKNIFRKR